MTRHKFNLSRAKVVGRNKRSKKAMSILREKLQNAEGDVSISPELNQSIWRKGGSSPPSKVTVEVEEENGRKVAYPAETPSQQTTTTQETSTTEESTEEDTAEDYSDVVGGTVGDAKDAISEMDNPDYEALLEAEKQGKDRKTLKEFIEGKMEG
ncbi:hypothetical protein [Candidatus Nanohalovita haloferacivicina]|uniref:hypothetical protein n=1 Tax=Candidatus Nanohalovita haloferacivicina TaxID=2978046 RepID=UPI00325FC36E|nr:Ribosomal protein L31E [Candidatus Nanohalobia archaeon BNXNv]